MEQRRIKQGLQVVGAVSLFAWTAVGVMAWATVEDHITIVISDGGTQELNQLALLEDRVDSFSGDLDALVAALESNFALLAGALESGRTSDAVARARMGERLAALEAALPSAFQARETAGALSAVLTRLERLSATEQAVAFRSQEPVAMTAMESPPEQVHTPAPMDVDEPVAALVAATSPAAEVEPVQRSFLAFKLPSRDFQFEGQHTFEILGDLSRVGFDAKSTLHDFSGVSNRVRGTFDVDLSRPEDGIGGVIRIESGSLTTGLAARDKAMWEHLSEEEFPGIEFAPREFIAAHSDANSMELDGQIKGDMTIRGVTRSIEMEVRAHVDESRRLVLEGEMPLLLSDYEVEIPSKLGMISTDDEVRIWIALRARGRSGGAGN